MHIRLTTCGKLKSQILIVLNQYIEPVLSFTKPSIAALGNHFPITKIASHETPIDAYHHMPRLNCVNICDLCRENLRHQCWSPTKSSQTLIFSDLNQLDERVLVPTLPQFNPVEIEDNIARKS